MCVVDLHRWYKYGVFTQFPLSFLLLTAVLLGTAVGAGTGVLATVLLRMRLRLKAIVVDALLGAVAFPSAFVTVLLIPWQQTATYRQDDAIVTTTMKHYQHPHMVAYVAAMLLPIAHEVWRLRGEMRRSAAEAGASPSPSR